MSKIALDLINSCLDNNEKFLDLGHCGLTDADFEPGAPVDIALRKCHHLEILIISDLFFHYEANEWLSSRNGPMNYLTKGPAAINELQKLWYLDCASNQRIKWHIENTEFVSQLHQLRYLSLGGNTIHDLNGLKNLASLKQINLSDNSVNNLEDLKMLQTLEMLILTRNFLTKLSGLENLKSLKRLDLIGNEIEDLTTLEGLVNMESLDLQGNNLSKIKNLKKITSLKELSLNHNPIGYIDDLSDLYQLRHLFLRRTKIASLEPLHRLSKLEYLDVNDNRISKLKGLENLKRLEYLDIGNNYVISLKALENLPALKMLDVRNNKISGLKNLEQLKKLEHLNIGYNKIKDFKSLEMLSGLKELDLSNTGINSMTYITHLKEVKKLFLRGNNLSDINGLETLSELMELDLSKNNITDITPLLPLTLRPENPLIIEEYKRDHENWGKIVITENPIKKSPIPIKPPVNENISNSFQTNEAITLQIFEQSEDNIPPATFRPGRAIQTDRFNRYVAESKTVIVKIHSQIVPQLEKYLAKKYSVDQKNISIELTKFGNNIADVVTLEQDGSYTIYEVKTGSNVRRNIREALGQLLDYVSHSGDLIINKMIIVSPIELTSKSKFFLDKLRAIIRCQIAYLQYVEPSDNKEPIFSLYE